MVVIKQLPLGTEPPRRIDGRILCGETVKIRIGRSGVNLFTLSYLPTQGALWKTFEPGEAAERAWQGLLPGAIAWGAFQDEQLSGIALAVPSATCWCELLDIRVDSAQRRNGIGTMLLDACRRYARTQGMMGIKATVGDDNPVACQFLEHSGFTLQGLDRMQMAMTPAERVKPLLHRTCALFFYQQFGKEREIL